MITFPEVLFTLNRWLRQWQIGGSGAISITIEFEDDKAFFNNYFAWRHEIASAQYMTMATQQDFPIETKNGHNQFSFKMIGHSVTFKSKEVHVEPVRAYFNLQHPYDI